MISAHCPPENVSVMILLGSHEICLAEQIANFTKGKRNDNALTEESMRFWAKFVCILHLCWIFVERKDFFM